MNMLDKLLTFIFVMILIVTSESSMAFFTNNLDYNEFSKLIKEKENSTNNNYIIDNVNIRGFELPKEKYKNINFINNTWENINAENKHFENIEFENCSFKNINFKSTTFINVVFNNCILNNVVLNYSLIKNLKFTKTKLISTDPNIQNSYRELNADTIVFKDSELDNIRKIFAEFSTEEKKLAEEDIKRFIMKKLTPSEVE